MLNLNLYMSVTDFSGFFVAQKGQDSNCSLFEPNNKQMLGTDPPHRFWLLYHSWSLIQHAFLYINNTRSARYRSSVLTESVISLFREKCLQTSRTIFASHKVFRSHKSWMAYTYLYVLLIRQHLLIDRYNYDNRGFQERLTSRVLMVSTFRKSENWDYLMQHAWIYKGRNTPPSPTAALADVVT